MGGILGIVMIALALFVTVPVAVNLPDSWPGAVLAALLACVGIALIVSHVRLGHRRQRRS